MYMFPVTNQGNRVIVLPESGYHRPAFYPLQKDIFILLFIGGKVLFQRFQIDNEKKWP